MSKRNVLTKGQDFQLMTWISCQRDRLERERPTQDAAAAEATKELGFGVSRSNLGSALDALGFSWQPVKKGRPAKQTLAELEARIAAGAERVQTLEAAVQDVRAELAAERAARRAIESRLVALEADVAPFAVTSNGKR